MHLLILMMLFTLCKQVTLLNSEINEMFRDKYCIQGLLVTTPTGPTIIRDVSNLKQESFDPASSSIVIEEDTLNSHLPPSQNTQQIFNPVLINTKGNTPMWLINELARYNKIQHQYRLINERGPAHQKHFTVTLTLGTEEYEAEGTSIKKAQHSAAAKALSSTQFEHPPQKITSNECAANKSPTSIINEITQKFNLNVIYEVVSEKGPPHMKEFNTVCRVEDLMTEGVGNSKKIAKKRAAEKMLDLLMQLPKVKNSAPRRKQKRTRPKNKNRNLIKGNLVGDFLNALFTVMPSKKLSSSVNETENLTFLQKKNRTSTRMHVSSNWQLVPELMNEQVSISNSRLQNQKKFLKADTAGTFSNNQPTNKKSSSSQNISSKDQLIRLAQLLDMQVEFSDLSKANMMYSTLVSLSITPPHVCYGEGSTPKASHEMAALEMLTMLSKLGIENFISEKDFALADIMHKTENLVMIESVMKSNGIKK